jgi:hypothetical protein
VGGGERQGEVAGVGVGVGWVGSLTSRVPPGGIPHAGKPPAP